MKEGLSNRLYFDVTSKSLNKKNEELCGDKVEVVRTGDDVIVVLSDGLGSGVKANILATLTSKIIATMMKSGATLEDTVDTIVHTLPVCKVRHMAYSTFSILKLTADGKAYLTEFDCPGCVWVHEGVVLPVDYTTREVGEDHPGGFLRFVGGGYVPYVQRRGHLRRPGRTDEPGLGLGERLRLRAGQLREGEHQRPHDRRPAGGLRGSVYEAAGGRHHRRHRQGRAPADRQHVRRPAPLPAG